MSSPAPVFSHPASRLALGVFRANGALIAAGDALVAPLGLTSARWQVLGAVAEAGGGLPVAGIARTMGLTRQAVQRVADDLVRLGMLDTADNPHHRRAKLLRLTPLGEARFAEAGRRWLAFADGLAEAIPAAEAEATAMLLFRLATRLASSSPAGEAP